MEITCRVYRPRDPRKTPLYGLLDSLYDRVKGAWEERFERSYVQRAPLTLRVGPGGRIEDVGLGLLDPMQLGEFFRP